MLVFDCRVAGYSYWDMFPDVADSVLSMYPSCYFVCHYSCEWVGSISRDEEVFSIESFSESIDSLCRVAGDVTSVGSSVGCGFDVAWYVVRSLGDAFLP